MPNIPDVNTGLVVFGIFCIMFLREVLALVARWRGNGTQGELKSLRMAVEAMHQTIKEQRCGYGPAAESRSQHLLEMAHENQKITDEQKTLTERGFFSCKLLDRHLAAIERLERPS